MNKTGGSHGGTEHLHVEEHHKEPRTPDGSTGAPPPAPDELRTAMTAILKHDDRFHRKTTLGFSLVLGAMLVGGTIALLMLDHATDEKAAAQEQAVSATATLSAIQTKLDEAEAKVAKLTEEQEDRNLQVAEAIESFLVGENEQERFATSLLGEKQLVQEQVAVRAEAEPDPSKAYDLWKVGYLASQQGDLDAAKEAYTAAIYADPTFAPAHNSMGMLHMRKREYDNAIDSFETALKHRRFYAPAKANVGLAYLQAGQTGEAVLTCMEALRAPKVIPLTHKLKQAVEAKTGIRSGEPLTCTMQSAARELRDEATVRWMKNEDAEAAVRLLRKACQLPFPYACRTLENYCNLPAFSQACTRLE